MAILFGFSCAGRNTQSVVNDRRKLMKAFRFVAVLVCCVAVFAVSMGCKKSDPAAAGAAAVAAVQVPASADQVINQGVAALKNNKPVEVFAMLPPSYQTDLQSVVNEITSKMDKEVFELGTQILEKVVQILDKHGAMLKQMGGEMAPFDIDEAIKSFKDFHAFMKSANLLSYDGFKALNVAGFLAEHGAKLMGDGMKAFETFNQAEFAMFQAMLAGVNATVKESTDDTATVELKTGDMTETVEFKKVEGRWVPADMAAEWSEMISEARKEAAEAMSGLAEGKEEIKGMLTGLLQGLTEFEKTGDISSLEALGGLL
jgi:hypothetical protein